MLIYALLFLLILPIVTARRNITLDDNNPAIQYYGDWLLTPYDPLNAGGRHVVTANSDSYATFTFIGVAIYFYSPLWPFRVTTSVSIDGGTPDLLDLRDYDQHFHQDGPETAASQVVWSMEDLRNVTHTLNVSVGMSEDLAILDALMYTVLDPGDTNSTSISHTMTNTRTLSANPTSSPTPTNTSPSSSKTGLSITLGVVCTIFGSLVFWAMFWFWRRHRKRLAEEESAIHADSNPDMSEATATRPRYPNTTGLPAAYKGKRFGSNKRRGPAPPSPLRSSGPHRRAARKKLSTIPEMSGDQDEASSSHNSSATTSATTSPDTSPSTSLKNNGPDDWTVSSSSPLTVRLVTDNNIS